MNKKTKSKPSSKSKARTSPSRRSHCLSMLLAMHRDGETEMARKIASLWREQASQNREDE